MAVIGTLSHIEMWKAPKEMKKMEKGQKMTIYQNNHKTKDRDEKTLWLS